MPKINNINFNKTTDKDTPKNVEPSKLLTFKFQKSVPKVKNVLQGSSMKAFFSSESDSTSKTLKNLKHIISTSSEDSNDNQSIIYTKQNAELEFSYKEPSWSGIPKGIFKIEVLRSGVILNNLDLTSKSYYTIGRSLSCDILLTHETISQFHAVLQYKKNCESNSEKGIYIYDVNSENGTFVNGSRIVSNEYIYLHSGCIITFGNDDKKFILHTPNEIKENEANLSARELQELHELELIEEQRLKKESLQKKEEERLLKEKELKGINWGIAEDVNENSMSSENIEDEESDNEESFIDDPKKALKDWFKWEGYDLEYQTEDKGFGYHSCWIDLTLDPVGTTERVIVNVAGDKMKAIDQCALKACRILNEYGFLKQSQEEKKTLSRNWEEVDYYDSDDDNFFDRTGTVEKKRYQRMQVAGKDNTLLENNKSELEKLSQIEERIKNLENLLVVKKVENDSENSNEDALDVFMAQLNTSTLNQTNILNIKKELKNLYQQKMQILNLMNSKELSSNGQSATCSQNVT